MGLFKKSVSKELIKLVRARDNGEEWAKKKLAELCRDDTVTIPDLCEARIAIYEAAAKRGDKEARYWMGFSTQIIDPQASFKWLLDLAREGDTRAMKALADGFSTLAYYGEDADKELYWHLEAARLGDAEAQFEAGRDYQLRQDDEKAWEWYEKSAEQGYTRGIFGLAELLIKRGEQYVFEAIQKGPAFQKEQDEAKVKCADACVEAEELLFGIIEEDFAYEDGARALDMLGDLYSRNLFYDSEPKYEIAVQHYYMATLFDEEERLISKKKMNDLIAREHLDISPTQFEEWKQTALGE